MLASRSVLNVARCYNNLASILLASILLASINPPAIYQSIKNLVITKPVFTRKLTKEISWS
jgi:hypothetical protein